MIERVQKVMFPRRGELLPEPGPAAPFPSETEVQNMTQQVEDDIREAMGTVRAAPDVGELSAAAIKQRFEEGAAAMEKMAADLVDNLRRNEAETISMVQAHEGLREQTQQLVEQCKRTADAYRREAELHGQRIKAASDLAGRVKQTCEELSGQIASS